MKEKNEDFTDRFNRVWSEIGEKHGPTTDTQRFAEKLLVEFGKDPEKAEVAASSLVDEISNLVWDFLAEAAEELHEEDKTKECAYCAADVPAHESVPGVRDDYAWDFIRHTHNQGCEWVETRAHRVGMGGGES